MSLRFQRRLTEHLNQQYITGLNFYKATELPQFRIDNIDQRVTTDVEVFCDQITELYTSLVKPGLDVVLNTWKMALDMGWRAGLITQGVPGVPQDPLAPPSGPRAPSPDSLKRTENPPRTP